jgi:hypothetical protein
MKKVKYLELTKDDVSFEKWKNELDTIIQLCWCFGLEDGLKEGVCLPLKKMYEKGDSVMDAVFEWKRINRFE